MCSSMVAVCLAPFREQFYDLITGAAPPFHHKRSRRHIPSKRLFKYSAYDNPVIPGNDTMIQPAPHPEAVDEEMMDDYDDPGSNSPDPPDPDPDLGYRERGHFPSDPDESSMEEGEYPSSRRSRSRVRTPGCLRRS